MTRQLWADLETMQRLSDALCEASERPEDFFLPDDGAVVCRIDGVAVKFDNVDDFAKFVQEAMK